MPYFIDEKTCNQRVYAKVSKQECGVMVTKAIVFLQLPNPSRCSRNLKLSWAGHLQIFLFSFLAKFLPTFSFSH